MKKNLIFASLSFLISLCLHTPVQSQVVKKGSRYDTIIVKHQIKPAVIPLPEFINQPYYFDKDGNKLIKLPPAKQVDLWLKPKA